VTRLIVLGADKFAVEVSAYIAEAVDAAELEIAGYVALEDEEVRVSGAPVQPLADHRPAPELRYVLAVSDIVARARLLRELIVPHGLALQNVVHRWAQVRAGLQLGDGNIIGPACYLGVNVVLGRANVLNASCSIGHHSIIGDDNFFAPDCHTGNSVVIGAHNLFGLGTVISQGVHIGDENRVQAATCILEPVKDGQLVLMTARSKQMGLYVRKENDV
jgi:acetyltransferase-like isoleucine patch superfamily enzyme